MFKILSDKTICVTRGDIADIEVFAMQDDGQAYLFESGAVVRFTVMRNSNCESVVLSKTVEVTEPAESVIFHLTSEDTRIGLAINRASDYWYEVEVNPDTAPQTIIGYDENGPKIFRLYPEGGAQK